MIVGQRQQLHRQFVEATRLAEQNDDLRTAADQLRRSAAKVNEELLSRVGAEIHDGPIQLLSVAMLGVGIRATESKVGKPDSHGPPCAAKLVGDVIQQLRTISTGLILPELEELLPSDVLLLAVTQHEKMYGTDVETYVDELPEVSQGLKAFMFRIVQECLNNSQRYADGKALKVEAHHDSSSIRLIVSDRGPGLRHFPEADDRPRLGLLGARNRVEAFGGNIDVSETPGGGLVVKVTLPVDLDEGDLAKTCA